MGETQYHPNTQPSVAVTRNNQPIGQSRQLRGPQPPPPPPQDPYLPTTVAVSYAKLIQRVFVAVGAAIALGGFLVWVIVFLSDECTMIPMDIYAVNFTKTQCNLNCSQVLHLDTVANKWIHSYCDLKWSTVNTTNTNTTSGKICSFRTNNVPVDLQLIPARRLETVPTSVKNQIRTGVCYTTPSCVKIYCSKERASLMKTLTGTLVLIWTVVPIPFWIVAWLIYTREVACLERKV